MNLSPQSSAASLSTWTEQDVRLRHLMRTGEAFYAARSRYHTYEGNDDTEEERLCLACGKARLAFAEACERFFVVGPVCAS
jgi:hypothetical protein